MAHAESDIESILLQASEIPSREGRDAFLAKACVSDPGLRSEVEGLLKALASAGSFLETPASEQHADLMTTAVEQIRETTAVREAILDALLPCDNEDRLGRLADYEIIKVIGQGATGLVLQAFDVQLQRLVALKVLAPHLAECSEARSKFLAEAQATAAISNDHVITIHAIHDGDPLPFLVMEFIAGTSLQERIDEDSTLPIAEVARIGKQIATGLAAAHNEGLIHRDIKPGNILLENSVARVKIVDFGLAQAIDESIATNDGMVAGTPQYMSPEQIDGRVTDHRTDLYSLGCVLYAMCAGHSPNYASTTLDVLEKVRTGRATAINDVNPDVPEILASLIHNLLERLPYDRLGSAQEVVSRLNELLTSIRAAKPDDNWMTPSEGTTPKMEDEFDPYYEWLGIPESEQPPTHYALLGVKQFESNVKVIGNAADRQFVFLRSFQLGPRSEISQRLLNEVSAARVCLLDAEKRAAYDEELREQSDAAASEPPPIQISEVDDSKKANAASKPTQRSSSQSTMDRRHRQNQQQNPVVELVKIVVGGVAGIVIAIAALWFLFGIDLLGVMDHESEGDPVVESISSIDDEIRSAASKRETRGTFIDESLLVLTFEDETEERREGNYFAVDALGGGHLAQIVNATRSSGYVGRGISFDGHDDLVQTTVLPSQIVSVSMWINFEEKSDPSTILSCAGPHTGYSLYPVPERQSDIRVVYGTGNDWKVFAFEHHLVQRVWHHVVFVFDHDNNQFSYYVDTVRRHSERLSKIAGLDRKPLLFGGRTVNSFNGKMDEIVLFDRTLSSLEIADLYLRGNTKRSLAD